LPFDQNSTTPLFTISHRETEYVPASKRMGAQTGLPGGAHNLCLCSVLKNTIEAVNKGANGYIVRPDSCDILVV
jgi:hypothetical protein